MGVVERVDMEPCLGCSQDSCRVVRAGVGGSDRGLVDDVIKVAPGEGGSAMASAPVTATSGRAWHVRGPGGPPSTGGTARLLVLCRPAASGCSTQVSSVHGRAPWSPGSIGRGGVACGSAGPGRACQVCRGCSARSQSTVLMLMVRTAAICLEVSSSAMSLTISASRGVRTSIVRPAVWAARVK